jgi:hypothetical protein
MVREVIDTTWRPWTGRRGKKKKYDGAVYERDRHLVIQRSRLRKLLLAERERDGWRRHYARI